MELLEPKKKKLEESALYQEAVSAESKFPSREAAIAALSTELEALAAQTKMSVAEVLKYRESSSEFNETYERIATLARQIDFLKK